MYVDLKNEMLSVVAYSYEYDKLSFLFKSAPTTLFFVKSTNKDFLVSTAQINGVKYLYVARIYVGQ